MDNLFEINPTKQDPTKYKYYGFFGAHDYLDDDSYPRMNKKDDCLAFIKIDSENKNQYYIKIGIYGKIYNPIGLYSEGKAKKFLSKIGKNEYNFDRVNEKVFNMYLNFLKTKNLAWLNNAERELV